MATTGADLPPKVIDCILNNIGQPSHSTFPTERWWRAEGRRNVLSCALVCLYWANKCRQTLFRQDAAFSSFQPTIVRSASQLDELEFGLRRDKSRLQPITDLIDGWYIEQDWKSASWCHRQHITPFKPRRNRGFESRHLALMGPIPSHLPPSALQSPHWSLPRSVPPCFSPFTHVYLTGLHFPAFASLIKLLKHFRFIEHLRLQQITWGVEDFSPMTPLSCVSAGTLRRVAALQCADNALVCVQASRAVGTVHAFSQLSSTEQVVCLGLKEVLSGSRIPSVYTRDQPDLSVTDNKGLDIFRTYLVI